MEALWLTSEVRERPVTPETELESTLLYLEGTIYDLAGSFWQAFLEELAHYRPGMKAPAPFLRFGSWVGADRDGNPNVTPETSWRAATELRASVLRYYRGVCERLLGVVSFPCRKPSVERTVRTDLERDMQRFPATRAFEAMDQPHEVYRRKLRVMIWRLERTVDGADGGYLDAPEFTCDVALLERLLRQHPSPRVAHLGPGRLRAAAEILGFHGASLDFRQHSAVTRAAASEIHEEMLRDAAHGVKKALAGTPEEGREILGRSFDLHPLVTVVEARAGSIADEIEELIDQLPDD